LRSVTPGLRELARVVADWAAPAIGGTIYLYGSRVRGEHRPDSDVDLYVPIPRQPTREFTEWWTAENVSDFAELRAALPGRLEFLERSDPIGAELEKGEVVYRDRNVVCVWRKAKPVVGSV